MKRKQDERISHIARHYNNADHVKFFSRNNAPANMPEKVLDKEFLTVFSNLDFDFPSDKTVALDIGCHSGRYIMGLLNNGFNAVGIDTAIIPLKYASEHVDGMFIRASVTDLPFKKERFDLVICIELLHHFEDDVLEKVLEEISGIIKPRGIFVFDVKNKMNPVLWYKYKKRNRIDFTLKARTNRDMAKLIEKHGFEVIKKKGILFPIAMFAPYVVVFGRKERVRRL